MTTLSRPTCIDKKCTHTYMSSVGPYQYTHTQCPALSAGLLLGATHHKDAAASSSASVQQAVAGNCNPSPSPSCWRQLRTHNLVPWQTWGSFVANVLTCCTYSHPHTKRVEAYLDLLLFPLYLLLLLLRSTAACSHARLAYECINGCIAIHPALLQQR